MIRVMNARFGRQRPNAEIKRTLFENGRTKVEEIVSRSGFSDPEGKWQEQDEDEFVRVLSGSADLLFQDGNQMVKMVAGDSIYIPAHTKHRVERVYQRTAWLAIFYKK